MPSAGLLLRLCRMGTSRYTRYIVGPHSFIRSKIPRRKERFFPLSKNLRPSGGAFSSARYPAIEPQVE